MPRPTPASEVSRRGFIQAASVTPALGLALNAMPEVAIADAPRIGGENAEARRTDDDLKAELDDYGFVVIQELIPRADALRVAERVKEIMSRQSDADKIDQHLPGLLNRLDPSDDDLFLPLLTQPLFLKLARACLGEGFQMTEVGCRWRKPGSQAGPARVGRPLDAMSRDGLPMPNVCFVLAFSWMLNDLERGMGGTYYLPFSQHAPNAPRSTVQYRYTVEVEAPAGSVLIHHGGVWHGFAANTTNDKSRIGLMSGYFPAWMDPVSIGWQPLKRSVRDRMPPVIQQMHKHVVE